MAKRKTSSTKDKKTGQVIVKTGKKGAAVVRVPGTGTVEIRAERKGTAEVRVAGTGIDVVRAEKQGAAVVRIPATEIDAIRAGREGKIVRTSIYTKKLGTRLASSAKPVNSRKYHIIIGTGKKWTVVGDGNTRATKVFETKSGAIEFAKSLVEKINGEVIIHKETGEIEDRVSLA